MLPPDLTQSVFEYLNPKTLHSAALVCKEWNTLSRADHIWSKIFSSTFGFPPTEIIGCQRQYYTRKILERDWNNAKCVGKDIKFPSTFGSLNFVDVNGDLIINGTMGGVIQAYNMKTLQIEKKFVGHKSAIWYFLYGVLENNQYMISTSNDKSIRIWWIDKQVEVLKIETDHPIMQIQLCEKRKIIMGSSWMTKFVDVWSIETGKHAFRVTLPNSIPSMNFDGTYLWCGSGKDIVRVDIDSKSTKMIKSAHNALVSCIRLTNEYIISGSNDHTVILWEKEKMREIHHFKNHLQLVKDVKFCHVHRNLDVIVSGSRDKTIKAYNALNGKYLGQIGAHGDEINQVFVSEDKIFSFSDKKGMIWTLG